MSRQFGVALSRIATTAPLSLAPVYGLPNYPIFAEPTEYQLDGNTTSDFMSGLYRLVGGFDNLALSVPIGIPDEDRQAIRDANWFTMDHSTAVLNVYDYRITSSDEDGILNVLFIDVTPGQVAAKLSWAETEADDWVVNFEDREVLDTAQVKELSTQDIIEKLVNPVVPDSTPLHRIYILNPEGPSSKLLSALGDKYPEALIRWASLDEISRGAAAAINRRPFEDKTDPILGNFNITSLPIGVPLADGRVLGAVPRSSMIPSTRKVLFTTSRDKQITVTLQFLIGNQPSARVVLEGLAPRPRGVPRIQATFEMDYGGSTVVTVEDLGTANRKMADLTNVVQFTEEDIWNFLSEQESTQMLQWITSLHGSIEELPE